LNDVDVRFIIFNHFSDSASHELTMFAHKFLVVLIEFLFSFVNVLILLFRRSIVDALNFVVVFRDRKFS
jgi:hypothetical protein